MPKQDKSLSKIQKNTKSQCSRLFATLRQFLITGIIVSTPIAATVYISTWIIEKVDTKIVAMLPSYYNPFSYLPFYLPGIGVLLLLGGLTLTGFIALSLFGKFLVGLGEKFVRKVPIVRSIYGSTKTIVETLLDKGSDSFKEVVLIEYPRRGVWSIGFITSLSRGEVQNTTADEVVNVFIPTTPNPTSGYLLFVPKDEIVKLYMSVEEGLQLVVSGGIITPPDRRPVDVQVKAISSSKHNTHKNES